LSGLSINLYIVAITFLWQSQPTQAKEVVLQFYQDRLEEEVTSSLRLEVLYLILLVVIEVSPTSDHVTFNHTWAGSLETGVSMHQE